MNLFRRITSFENWLGIHRNYSLLSKKRKILAIIQVVVQMCLSLIIAGFSIAMSYAMYDLSDDILIKFQLFCVLTLVKNMIITIGGIVNAGSHIIFLENVSSLDTRFENEPSYFNSEKKLNQKCFVVSILFAILSLLVACMRVTRAYFAQNDFILEISVLIIYEFWVDIRYMLEHLVIYCAITLICKYVKCLNVSVLRVLEKYRDADETHILLDANEDIEIAKKVCSWTEVYLDIMTSSKHISKCFNGMMFLSLVAAVLHTVSSVYELIGLMVMKSIRMCPDIDEVVYVLIYHMGATITLLYAGQKLQNEFGTLNIALASLANRVSIYDQKSVIRSLRDLNRIVTTNAIVIKFGNFTLGMYLLPMMLSLSATYIVVMLQFNHVI